MKKTLLAFFTALQFVAIAQTSEYFGSATDGAATFTSNSQAFTLTNKFLIKNLTGAGVDANTPASPSGSSAKFVDNYNQGATNQVNSIKTANSALFTIKHLYYYVSNDLIGSTPTTSGNITFRGKKAGTTMFTRTISSGFASDFTSYQGFNYLDFSSGTDHSSINIDELEVTLGGAFIYVAIDNFRWSTGVACSIGASISSQVNVACNGGNTGSLTVTRTGGTSDFSYSWSNGASTIGTVSTVNSIAALAANGYTVTVADANGCTATTSATITQPLVISVTPATQTNISCNGGTNGAAAINTPTGGAGGYLYNWTPGNPTGDGTVSVTGLSAGTWTVQVTDANSCTKTQTFNITQPNAITVTPLSQTNISCNGGTNGAAAINTPTGGAGGYLYNWTPGNPTGDGTVSVTGLSAGTWTCQVTDANSCTATQTFSVTQPNAIVLTQISQTNVACNGASTGAATISATAGAGGFIYNWTPGNPTGDGTASVTGLIAGIWSCQVTDANSCTAAGAFNITQPPAISLTPASQANISCNGLANGTAAVNTATGGAGGFIYNWTPGNPTGDGTTSVSGLISGTWTCQVTDANSCTATNTFTISEPAIVTAIISSKSNVACNGGNNGSITVSGSGGTGAMTYSWSNGGTSATINSLVANSYTVTVLDVNGCSATTSSTITQPTAISFTAASQTNVSCFGGSNGAAAANPATGGASGFNYNWTPGNPTGDGTTSVTGLISGTWTCQVTDANSCTASLTFTLTQPNALTATISSQTNVACNGGNNGSLTVTSTGGTGSPTYTWSTGSNLTTITTLTANNYTVTVVDANGCTKTAAATITQPPVLTAVISSQTNISCNGFADGSLTATALGGAGSAMYSWSNGGNTATISPLAPNTYMVTVTDINACTKTAAATITQPSVLIGSITSQTNVSCNGVSDGSLTATATGGAGSASYTWSNGGTTATITTLAANTYTVTVMDINSCVKTASATITEPSPLIVTSSATNVSCNGNNDGTATVFINGGTQPYIQAWSPVGGVATTASGLLAGVYTVQVIDDNGCIATASAIVTEPLLLVASISSQTNVACNGNTTGALTVTSTGGSGALTYAWSNGSSNATITGLSANTYTVTVTDVNNCTATTVATITQASPYVINTNVKNLACHVGSDGAASVTVNGATQPYQYSWSNTTANDTIQSVSAGTYTCTITDANNCIATATVIITAPPVLAPNLTVLNAACNGGNGNIIANPSGGVMPYTYSWSDGTTGNILSSVAPGVHSLLLFDSNGCSLIAVETIAEPSVLSTSFNPIQNVTCFGASDGSVTAIATGGTTGYSYTWSSGSTAAIASSLTVGIYTVTVTDDNNCTIASTVVISEPDQLIVTASVSANPICAGESIIGSAILSGGTAPIACDWSGNISGTNPTLTPIVGNTTYTVTATDANGCTATTTTNVLVNSKPVVAFSVGAINDTLCANSATLSLSGSPAGGTFSGTGVSGNTFDPATANQSQNIITYTYADGNGCSGSAKDSIFVSTCVGVNNSTEANNNINIYPNPANANITIGIADFKLNQNTQFEIINTLGQTVLANRITQSQTIVDISTLSSGIYSVRTSNGLVSTITKLIVR